MAGGLDSFKLNRSQYFNLDNEGLSYIEKAIKFGSKYQESVNSSQINLFGEDSNDMSINPILPECDEWINLEKLKKEREVVGIYISAHPLDDFIRELNNFFVYNNSVYGMCSTIG